MGAREAAGGCAGGDSAGGGGEYGGDPGAGRAGGDPGADAGGGLAEEIARVGSGALFDQPIWLAIHNYSSNRPPHYPDDAAHSEGAPTGREFYAALAAEAWQGRPLGEIDDVGRQRADSEAQPAGLDDDTPDDWREKLAAALEQPGADQPHTQRVHWRALERLNDEMERLIGRSLPILSTASGYLMNDNADPRYPATTAPLHTAQTLEICRAMMGTSRHTPPAPDYYFCTAFWLLAHEALQGSQGRLTSRTPGIARCIWRRSEERRRRNPEREDRYRCLRGSFPWLRPLAGRRCRSFPC